MFEQRHQTQPPQDTSASQSSVTQHNPWQLVSLPTFDEIIRTAQTAEVLPDPALRNVSCDRRMQPLSDILREQAQRTCAFGTVLGVSCVFLGSGFLTASLVALQPETLLTAVCSGLILGGSALAIKSWEMAKSFHQARIEALNPSPSREP